eukprot:m.134099 g.134099  ORF g.134099 m.134099 type:complete len:105 (+) comp9868_c1_seq6:1324-1638(+)
MPLPPPSPLPKQPPSQISGFSLNLLFLSPLLVLVRLALSCLVSFVPCLVQTSAPFPAWSNTTTAGRAHPFSCPLTKNLPHYFNTHTHPFVMTLRELDKTEYSFV